MRSLWVGLVSIVCAAAQAQAEGFNIDSTAEAVRQQAGMDASEARPRLMDLAPGETGYAYPRYCRREAALFVHGEMPLAVEPYEYLLNTTLTVTGDGLVSIGFEAGAKADADLDDWMASLLRLFEAHLCARDDEALMRVADIAGADSVSGAAKALIGRDSAGDAARPDSGADSSSVANLLSREWFASDETDPITDQKNVFRTKLPQETPRNKFGGEKSVSLMARCVRNTTSLIISFDSYQIKDRIPVTWRFDDTSPQSGRWSVSTSRQAAGLWNGSSAIPFIRQMMQAQKLVLRLSLDDGTETYTFDLSGAPEQLSPLAQACNWSP